MKGRNFSLEKLKYTLRSLSYKDKIRITILGVVAILAIAILTAHLYFFYTETKTYYTSTFKEGLTVQPKSINPLTVKNDTDRAIASLIYSGLLKQNRKNKFEPDIAKELPTPMEGKNNYKICIKDDISWHNGRKFSLEDIIFTFSTAKKINNPPPAFSSVRLIDIKKLNKTCLKINSELSKNQLYSFLTLGILPKHVWKNVDISNNTSEFNIRPVGTGMFKFSSLAQNQEDKIEFYKLEKNKNFYSKDPNIKNIKFQFYSDFNKAYQALKTKKIDALGSPITTKKPKTDHIKKHKFSWDFYNALFFNLKKFPFGRRYIRKVLAYLTPQDKILKELLNYNGTPIKGPVLPSSYFYNPNIKETPYNPKKARNTLEKNGWNKNNNGFWENDGEILEFSLTTISQPGMSEIAKKIQESWQSIGLKVKLVTVPTERAKDIISNKNFDVILYGVLQSQNTGLFPLWHSADLENTTLNITNLDSRRVDNLLEKAIVTSNLQEKKSYYQEFQQIISNQIPAIFLFSPNYTYFTNKNIKGIRVKRIGQTKDRFLGIESWYNKSKRVWK